MTKQVSIGDHLVGTRQPCLIIAEAGVNHNGNLSLAHQLIDAAVESGANAVKFQSFITDEIIIDIAPKAKYQVETTDSTISQYELLKSLELSFDQQAELKRHCDEAGILYLCTPYETVSVDRLDEIGVHAFKIASTDTNNLPFLRYLAAKGRPAILSTGMSTLGEVEKAVCTLQKGGLQNRIVILQCTSEYPVPLEDVNLLAMKTMEQAFGCPIGFSDHTRGIGASPWAVALGAVVIEKHFTLDRSLPGPDHRASLEPGEFADLVQTIRAVEAALGDGIKRIMPSEAANKLHMQKSLTARQTVEEGHTITEEDIGCRRPAGGLAPEYYSLVIGRRAARTIRAGEQVSLAAVEWDERG